ncbi:MAG: hypothetical protein ACWGN7_08040, partial [Thermodesulfovibrionales bacterium]
MRTFMRNVSLAMLLGLGTCFLGALVTPSSAFAELTARANHDRISIGFFYNGSTVSVSGVSEPETDLIVKIAAPPSDQAL